MAERINVKAGGREFPGALSGSRLTCLACQAGEALAEGAVIEIGERRWRVASVRDPYALSEAEARRTIEGRIIGKASNTAVSKMVAEARKDFGKFILADLVEET